MSGKEVKDILLKNNYQLNEIAVLMEETPQNLHSMLKAVDIKTGVLEKIAKAINKSLYFFFQNEDNNQSQLHDKQIEQNELSILKTYLKEKDDKIELLIQERTKLEIQLQAYKKSHIMKRNDVECVNIEMMTSK